MLMSKGTAAISTGLKMSELIKRPQISYDDLAPLTMNALSFHMR